jgi:chromosome segregation ATPase
MKKLFYYLFCVALSGVTILSFQACGGNQTEALQSQVDSLTATIEQQNQDLEFYQSCLFLVSDGLDSIAKADNNLIAVASSKEKTITRESIRQDLDAYASLLTRQRERISQLERQMGEGGKDRERMQGIINLLNKQIEEKDATIQQLQKKIETKDFNINLLLDEINHLNATVAAQKQEIQTKEKTIEVAQEMLNEAYYIVGSSKELKQAGVLQSKFLAKSKVNVDEIDASVFTKIDISKFHQLTIQSKKITIKSQHPSTSYRITTDKKSGITTLEILEEQDFWSISRFLIIQS